VLVETQIKNHVLPSDEDLGFKNMWRKKKKEERDTKRKKGKREEKRSSESESKGFYRRFNRLRGKTDSLRSERRVETWFSSGGVLRGEVQWVNID
jgi:hypothetical protein